MPCIRHGAGLLFFPVAIQPHTSVYSAFCAVHAVIPPTPQNSAQGFTVAFPAICRVLLLLCGRASCYAVQPARRWRVYKQAQHLHRYQIPTPRQTLYRSAQPPYHNKVYIRVQRCALLWIHVRRCSITQTMPARRGQFLPCADCWQVLTRFQQYRPGVPSQPGTFHPAGQPGSRNAAGGAEPLTAAAVSLFGLSPDSQ